MSGSAQIVAKKRLADGAWAITLRCDDDPATDTVHTIYAAPGQTPESIAQWVEERKAAAYAQHLAHKTLDGVLGVGS